MARTVFTPGDEPECIAQLRLEYGDDGVCNPTSINNITLVGAKFSPSSICNNDLNWLQCSLEACRLHGIPIAQDFCLTPLNIALDKGDVVDYNQDQDFLIQNIPTDLLIVGFIYNPWLESHYKRTFDPHDEIGRHPAHRLSPQHREKDAWAAAAERNGTNIITVFCGNGPDDLTSAAFRPLRFREGSKATIQMDECMFYMNALIRSSVPYHPHYKANYWRSRYHNDNTPTNSYIPS